MAKPLKGDLIGDTSTYGLYNGQPINIGQKKDMGHLRIRNTNKQNGSFLTLNYQKMSKTKRIKQLEGFIELESKEVNPNKEYIAICQEAVDKLKQELEIEERRVNHYLILLTANKRKREQSYINRKQVKAGEHESYRQRKIRLNKERRESVRNG